jgi:hypothetical protein
MIDVFYITATLAVLAIAARFFSILEDLHFNDSKKEELDEEQYEWWGYYLDDNIKVKSKYRLSDNAVNELKKYLKMKPKDPPRTIPDEVHVHFLVQHFRSTYENIYQRYGHLINEKGMMLTKHLKMK